MINAMRPTVHWARRVLTSVEKSTKQLPEIYLDNPWARIVRASTLLFAVLYCDFVLGTYPWPLLLVSIAYAVWWFERTIREWKPNPNEGDDERTPRALERAALDQVGPLREGQVVNEEPVLQRALEHLDATHERIRQLKAEIEDCEGRVAALDNFIGMYRQYSSMELRDSNA